MMRHRVFRLVGATMLYGTVVLGCQVQLVPRGRPWVHEQVATGTVTYSSGDFKPSSETFHRVGIDHLRQLGGDLTYLGTEGEYHLMRVWRKIKTDPSEIMDFAVRRSECDVESAQTCAKEFEEHGASYRNVVWLDALCTVPRRP